MKIICVGMNYSRHNKELGETLLTPDSPVIFMKPDSAILRNRRPFFLPDHLGRVDYETELVVRINRLGKSISARFADRYIDAVTLGIDFTARDMQNDFRREGLPWELCKGFDQSAVVGDWIPKDRIGDLQNLHFRLDIDGNTVQEGFRIFAADDFQSGQDVRQRDILRAGHRAGEDLVFIAELHFKADNIGAEAVGHKGETNDMMILNVKADVGHLCRHAVHHMVEPDVLADDLNRFRIIDILAFFKSVDEESLKGFLVILHLFGNA